MTASDRPKKRARSSSARDAVQVQGRPHPPSGPAVARCWMSMARMTPDRSSRMPSGDFVLRKPFGRTAWWPELHGATEATTMGDSRRNSLKRQIHEAFSEAVYPGDDK